MKFNQIFLYFFKIGINIKRWILIFFFSILSITLSLVLLFNKQFYYAIKLFLSKINLFFSVPFKDYDLRITIIVLSFFFGLIFFVYSLYKIIKFILRIDILKKEIIYSYDDKTNIVCIGGGTGLYTLLRGLKKYFSNLYAIVTMADDGGSSGKLRMSYGILPPGDVRNCLIALSKSEKEMYDLFSYRFKKGEFANHSFGNLAITAMVEKTNSYSKAIELISKILNITGMVIPNSLTPVSLNAKIGNKIIKGESKIPQISIKENKAITDVFLTPKPKPNKNAINSIKKADFILIGPGSFYTSIMPNLVISEIQKQINSSDAKKIFIVNVLNQHGETDNFKLSTYIEKITKIIKLDYVIVNNKKPSLDLIKKYKDQQSQEIENDILKAKEISPNTIFILNDLLSTEDLIRHDSKKLSSLIKRLVNNKKL